MRENCILFLFFIIISAKGGISLKQNEQNKNVQSI